MAARNYAPWLPSPPRLRGTTQGLSQTSMDFTEQRLTKWDDIHALPQHGWLYRGQRDARWPLQTSFDRCMERERIEPERRPHIESEFIREFRRSYHHYAVAVPSPSAPLEWLSIMQHHGAPTRLLDFSYSIYVAAYFALEAADGDSAVWAVNGPWALNQSAKLFQSVGPKREYVPNFLNAFTEREEDTIQELFFSEPHVRVAAPVNPFRLNERLRLQKGAFLCPGTVDAPFMDNLAALPGYGSADHILKIVIPAGMRAKAIQQLNAMNVASTTLFPGLDGFARSLGVYHISFNPVSWVEQV